MSDTHSEFMSAHNDVLVLRKRIEKMRSDLFIAESTLRDAERESAVLFRKLYDRPEPTKQQPTAPRRDWHYDSQGYCDNPWRGY